MRPVAKNRPSRLSASLGHKPRCRRCSWSRAPTSYVPTMPLMKRLSARCEKKKNIPTIIGDCDAKRDTCRYRRSTRGRLKAAIDRPTKIAPSALTRQERDYSRNDGQRRIAAAAHADADREEAGEQRERQQNERRRVPTVKFVPIHLADRRIVVFVEAKCARIFVVVESEEKHDCATSIWANGDL